VATSFGTTDPSALTKREIEVLRHLADGLTADQIATRIERSASTVRQHIETLRAKLGARNATHAVHLGHTAGHLNGGKQ
jgi:DNA-binding CsgD family transcriptional regulator